MSIIEFNSKLCVGQGFQHRAFHFNVFFFRHSSAYAPWRSVFQTAQYSGVNRPHPQSLEGTMS